MNTRKVFHVARQTIKSFDDEHVEFVLTRFIHELKQTVTAQDGAAGAGSVIERRDNIQSLTICVCSAQSELIVD